MSAFFCVRTIGSDFGPRGIEMARLLLQHWIGCNGSLFVLRYSTIYLKERNYGFLTRRHSECHLAAVCHVCYRCPAHLAGYQKGIRAVPLGSDGLRCDFSELPVERLKLLSSFLGASFMRGKGFDSSLCVSRAFWK